MKTSNHNQGFTLPEVVISSMLVLILMIPISRIAYSTLLSTRYARDIGSAISVGQEQLELFSEMSYGDIAAGSATRGEYELSWTLTRQDSAKIVALTVSWHVLSKEREVNLSAVYVDEIGETFNPGL